MSTGSFRGRHAADLAWQAARHLAHVRAQLTAAEAKLEESLLRAQAAGSTPHQLVAAGFTPRELYWVLTETPELDPLRHSLAAALPEVYR